MAVLNAEAPDFFSGVSRQNYFHSQVILPYYTAFPTYCNPPCFSCLLPLLHHAPPPLPYGDTFYYFYPTPTPTPPPTNHHLLPYVSQEPEVEKGVVSENLVSRPFPSNGFTKRRYAYGFPRNHRRQVFETYQHNKKSSQKWIPKEKEERVVNTEKKQPKVLACEPVELHGSRTTVMIRNIPNKYTREMLLELLDKHCSEENLKLDSSSSQEEEEEEEKQSAYDFVYLPIDFESNCNKGYAFVNLTEPIAAWRLHQALHNYHWGILNSKKICEISYARIQGKQGLINHFQQSSFFCEAVEYLPVYFDPCRDGSGESVEQFSVGRRINPTVKKLFQF